MTYKKEQGWEIRLDNVFKKYYRLPYELGKTCCFSFISECMEAICGETPLEPWVGKYKTMTRAMALLRKESGAESFEYVFHWFTPVKSFKFAQRGDFGVLNEDGKELMGIVSLNGREFLLRTENSDGLMAIKLNDNIKLWRAL